MLLKGQVLGSWRSGPSMEPAARSKRDDLDHQCVFHEAEPYSSTADIAIRRASAKQAPHHSSKQLQDCLNPVRGIRDAQRRSCLFLLLLIWACPSSACGYQWPISPVCRQGIEPVNHARHNAAAIRRASEANCAHRKSLQAEEAAAACKPRPSSAASVRSSGYASPGYAPRCASLQSEASQSPSCLSSYKSPCKGLLCSAQRTHGELQRVHTCAGAHPSQSLTTTASWTRAVSRGAAHAPAAPASSPACRSSSPSGELVILSLHPSCLSPCWHLLTLHACSLNRVQLCGQAV